MNIIDILLMPFVWLYKGFIFVLMIPYYLIEGIVKLFKKAFGKNTKVENKAISEIKGKDVKVVKGVRSAYSTPVKPDIVISEETKKENITKKQKEFAQLVKKARQEEQKRVEEQEKLRKEREKREQEKLKKEQLIRKKEEAYEAKKEAKEAALRKNGKPVSFSDKVDSFFKKLTYSKKAELELEAKKTVLNEQFKDKTDSTARFAKPIVFDYVAKNANGEIEKSSIEALSRVDVHSFLLAEGYEVYDITAAKPSPFASLNGYKFKKSKLIFCLSQLSAYLKSGIALADAVKILDEQTKKIKEKKVWHAVYYDLSMGDNLSLAMEKRNDAFPKLLINMIKTAEMTGNLPETLDDMVDYYTESESTRKQVKSAMMYPAIVSIFAIVVVIFILVWIVPQFASIYEGLGSEIPAITKFVMSISDFLGSYLIYIILVIVLIVAIYLYLFRNVKSFRQSMQQFMMKIPVFGEIIIYSEVNIFAKTFANLLNHNVFITDSVDVLSKITDNEIYKKLIHDTTKNLTKGEPISAAFKDHWAFPNIAYQMLITGEKTGRLGAMMEKVSDYYQEQHRTIINQMKSLIEPILIVSLAVIVGGILLAVIIPMYGVYGEIG